MQFFKDNQEGYWIRAAGQFYPVPDPSKIPEGAAIQTLEKPPLDYQGLRERAYRRRVPLSRALEAIFEYFESPSRPEKLDLILADRSAIKARHPKPATSEPEPQVEITPEPEATPESQ